MPSRQNPILRPKPFNNNRTRALFLILTVSSSLLIFFALIYFIYHLWSSLLNRCSRTIPFFDVAADASSSSSPSSKLQLFSYKELKLATNDFDEANVIGKGGSGTVFRGITRDGKLFAVKRLDSVSLQSEAEFQNELQILGGLKSSFLVTLLGYCFDEKDHHHRFLVYEYMPNKSLQELLFNEDGGGSCLSWERRFSIVLDVAKALEFMHFGCDPPVIHGDIKPSNVLLDCEFRAKISDFGLSRVKVEEEGGYGVGVDLFSQELSESTPQTGVGTPTHHHEVVDFSLALQASSSSKNSRTSRNIKAMNLAMEEGEGRGKEVEENEEMNVSPNSVLDLGKQWGRDWWWKQEGSGELCSKDYVREWIGSQIHNNTEENPDWDNDEKKITISTTPELGVSTRTVDKAESGLNESRFDTLQEKFAEEETHKKSKKHRNMEEWWKEEEHNNKNKIRVLRVKFKNRLRVPHFRYCFHGKGENTVEDRGEGGEAAAGEFSFRRGWRRKSSSSSNNKNKKKNKSIGSEMWSGDLFSRELSSTTSMRGTLCYIAPEYGGGGCCYLMEKGDIYSFGVLILVIISGRRPLHVLASPMKLEKANLVSWCRQLAQSGNVLELVDERLKDLYNKEEAGLCINLALACLQKAPELRPDISEVVRILRGEMEISAAAFEFSPSPPAKIYGSRSKRRS